MEIADFTPELMVNNVDKTLSFYTEILGLKLLDKEEDDGKMVWGKIKLNPVQSICFKDAGKVKAEFSTFEKSKIGATISFIFQINKVKAIYSRLPQSLRVIQKLHISACNLNQFSIEDPDGYILTFTSQQPS